MQEFTLCHVSNVTVYPAHANKPLFVSDNLSWMRVFFLNKLYCTFMIFNIHDGYYYPT